MPDVPEWVEKQRTLRSNVVDWPLHAFRVLPMGAYGAVRSSPENGWCPYKNNRKKDPDPDKERALRAADYPCKHYGVDLSAPKGTPVYAPHDGWILYAGVATSAPFVGYGPGVVLLAHHDVGDSVWERGWQWATGPALDIFDFPEGQVATRYSLLGHIVPLPYPPGEARPTEVLPIELDLPEEKIPVPLPPDIFKSTEASKDPRSDHWRPLKDGTVVMMTAADAVTQTEEKKVKRYVHAGDLLGHVSDANHVHWEIRSAPLAGREGRIDPIAVWQQAYGAALPAGADVSEPDTEATPVAERPASGGGGILLLLAAFIFGRKKQSRRRKD